jgi:hypothetical protein
MCALTIPSGLGNLGKGQGSNLIYVVFNTKMVFATQLISKQGLNIFPIGLGFN